MASRDSKLSTKAAKKGTKPYTDGLQNSAPQQHGVDSDGVPDNMADAVREALSADSTILQPLITSVVTNIMKSPEIFNSLVEAVTKAVTEKISQSIYDSMSHDIACTQEKVDQLEDSIKELKIANDQLKQELDDAEQYSRRNCLLLHGIKESKKENTTTTFIETMGTHLGIELSPDHIDRSHRLGRHGPGDKPRPIIIKFVSYRHRELVYRNKRKLKNSSLLITESLTSSRMALYREAHKMTKEGRIKSVWSTDGRIVVLSNKDDKITVSSRADLEKL